MTTLKIEKHAAERLIARILRDELKILPAKANEMATKICSGIEFATPDPLRSGFGAGWRAIPRSAPRGEVATEIVAKLRQSIPQADKEMLEDLWSIIYEYGREVPDAVIADL